MEQFDHNQTPAESGRAGEQPASGTQQNKEDRRKDDAAAVAVVLFFILDLIAMAVSAALYPPLCMACLGVPFLIIGISSVRKMKIDWESWPVLAFPLIGFLLTVLPVIDLVFRKITGQTIFTTANIGLMIASAFFVTGVLLLLMPLLKRYFMMQTCTEPVMAECIGIDRHLSHGEHGAEYSYAPKWRYVVNGTAYEQQESAYTNRHVPEIGEYHEIYVNPDCPAQIYRKNLFTLSVSTAVGAGSLLASLTVFYFILFVH